MGLGYNMSREEAWRVAEELSRAANGRVTASEIAKKLSEEGGRGVDRLLDVHGSDRNAVRGALSKHSLDR